MTPTETPAPPSDASKSRLASGETTAVRINVTALAHPAEPIRDLFAFILAGWPQRDAEECVEVLRQLLELPDARWSYASDEPRIYDRDGRRFRARAVVWYGVTNRAR